CLPNPNWKLVPQKRELKIIPAESGQDVTLTCRAPNNNIRVVKWSRADLGDENVLLYQDGHFDPTHQHPSFKNRVDLHDSWMKDGDASLILKDVTINDTGTYECLVAQNSNERMEVMSRISLRVTGDCDFIQHSEQEDDIYKLLSVLPVLLLHTFLMVLQSNVANISLKPLP
uniref:Ig-like domain-containing protein n=1 Tax=Oreochromis aureus TaxID=47969 RepID=A0A668SWU2_OREAU